MSHAEWRMSHAHIDGGTLVLYLASTSSLIVIAWRLTVWMVRSAFPFDWLL
jgi:hypothetical protein